MPQAILSNKAFNAKQKTEMLAEALSTGAVSLDTLIQLSANLKEPDIANFMEALEHVTQNNSTFAGEAGFAFALKHLNAKAPRLRWESARVIGNIAAQHTDKLEKTIAPLLDNTTHSGTVVRWSAAFALSEILKLKTSLNKNLIPLAEEVLKREEKNSIKKIYLAAFKKAGHTPTI